MLIYAGVNLLQWALGQTSPSPVRPVLGWRRAEIPSSGWSLELNSWLGRRSIRTVGEMGPCGEPGLFWLVPTQTHTDCIAYFGACLVYSSSHKLYLELITTCSRLMELTKLVWHKENILCFLAWRRFLTRSIHRGILQYLLMFMLIIKMPDHHDFMLLLWFGMFEFVFVSMSADERVWAYLKYLSSDDFNELEDRNSLSFTLLYIDRQDAMV